MHSSRSVRAGAAAGMVSPAAVQRGSHCLLQLLALLTNQLLNGAASFPGIHTSLLPYCAPEGMGLYGSLMASISRS